MPELELPDDLQDPLRPVWRRYLDHLVPFRPALHRYCTRLTGSVWDGEDLVQDTILRVFSMLGKATGRIDDPRGYLIRTATHLWIDRVRRRRVEQSALEVERVREEMRMEDPGPGSEQSAEVRDAARELLGRLAPQERAAVLLKDVFDLSLQETAAILQTTLGAVKSALHRGRTHLGGEESEARPIAEISSAIVDRFVAAMGSRDLAKLHEITSENLHVELVGGVEMQGRDETNVFFLIALSDHAPGLPPEQRGPRFEAAVYQGEAVALGFRWHDGVEGLNEIHRLRVEDGSIAGIRCYCFCPDTLQMVASELGLRAVARPYRSP